MFAPSFFMGKIILNSIVSLKISDHMSPDIWSVILGLSAHIHTQVPLSMGHTWRWRFFVCVAPAADKKYNRLPIDSGF